MIDFTTFSVEHQEEGEDAGRVRVVVVLMVDDEDEAFQIVKGCRSLGAREPHQHKAPLPASEERQASSPAAAPQAEPARRGRKPRAAEPDPTTTPPVTNASVQVDAAPHLVPPGPVQTATQGSILGPPAPEPSVTIEPPASEPKGGVSLTITKGMKEKRFRGVIKELWDQGFRDSAQLLNVCTAILEKVPALKQAGLEKLGERIDLALETIEDEE